MRRWRFGWPGPLTVPATPAGGVAGHESVEDEATRRPDPIACALDDVGLDVQRLGLAIEEAVFETVEGATRAVRRHADERLVNPIDPDVPGREINVALYVRHRVARPRSDKLGGAPTGHLAGLGIEMIAGTEFVDPPPIRGLWHRCRLGRIRLRGDRRDRGDQEGGGEDGERCNDARFQIRIPLRVTARSASTPDARRRP